MSATTTPRPWHVGPHYKGDVESREGRVCQCGQLFSQRGAADAALIVRVANLHDDLLAALRLIESVYRQNCVAPGEPSSVLDAVQAVLARADASQEAQTKK